MVTANWLLDARLLLCGSKEMAPPIQLARGCLAEMITEALDISSIDSSRLLIEVDRGEERYDWRDIRQLAGQPDFPVLI